MMYNPSAAKAAPPLTQGRLGIVQAPLWGGVKHLWGHGGVATWGIVFSQPLRQLR